MSDPDARISEAPPRPPNPGAAPGAPGRPLRRIWRHLGPGWKPLVGMVHLPALPGAPRWGGSMEAVLERAQADARALEEAGFDGVLVENYGDVPFFPGAVPPETVAALARVTAAVVDRVALPVGVNVLRNDARAALGVAVAAGARFVRVNVHTGVLWTDQGVVEGRAAETLRARAALTPPGESPVAILADVLVKHATSPPGLEARDAARDAWHRGLADGLLVTGAATGRPTDGTRLEAVRAAVPEAPVWVASGVTRETVRATLEAADGAIVGTALTRTLTAGSGVDPKRARALVEAARG